MTKGRAVMAQSSGQGMETADPSTTLRFVRDDKGRVVAYLGSCDWDVWSCGSVGSAADLRARTAVSHI